MRRRWISTGLAVLLALVAAVVPNDSLAQSCNPRPNVRVSASKVSDGRLSVVVLAGAGAISAVQFPGSTTSMPGAPNYVIMTDGQARALPFALVPPPGATQVSFDIVRTGGSSVTVPLVVVDACGPWRTFVGGGGPALDPPPVPKISWSPVSLAVSATPGTSVTRTVRVTTTATLSGASLTLSPALQPLVSVVAPRIATLPTGPGDVLALTFNVPTSAALGTVRGELTVQQSGSTRGASLPIALTVLQPSAATVPDGFANPTFDRIAFPPDESPFVKDQVLVEVAPGTGPARVDRIAADVGAVVVGKESELNWYHFQLRPGSPTLSNAITQLRLVGDVRMAVRSLFATERADPPTPRTSHPTPRTPNDPRFERTWSESAPGGNNWGHELVQLPSAWALTTGSRTVKIGVVEGGFQQGHQDFGGNIDSIHGENPIPLFPAQWDHGTQVAGVIGARGNNAIGFAGVNWDTTMILHGVDLAFTKSGLQERIATSILRAVLDGAVVVNVSMGRKYATTALASEGGEPYKRVIRILRDDRHKEFLLVAASHDESLNDLLSMPSGLAGYKEFPNVVSVTSVKQCAGDQCKKPLRFTESGYGPSITLAAPGQFITTTTSSCSILTAFGLLCPTDQYASVTGTSFATPFASGVAGLVLARQQQLGLPPLTAERLRKNLLDGAMAGDRWVCRFQDVVTSETCEAPQGIPILNAWESLRALVRSPRLDTGSVGPGGTPAIPGPPIPPVNYVVGSGAPTLSADGRLLAFETHSLNLVPETNDRTDIGSSVLVKDLQTGTLEWVSDPAHVGQPSVPAVAGTQASAPVRPSSTSKVYAISPSMSADGRYVAFVEYTGTSASNKTTNIVVYDRTARTYQVFPQGSLGIGGGQLDGTGGGPTLVISGDGSTIVFKVAPDTATGLFFGDLVSMNRATGQKVSIGGTLVLRERPQIACTAPPPNACTEEVPLREAAPEIMGRGISTDGRRVVVRACCYHVYRIDQGVAARVDPDPPPPVPEVTPYYPRESVGLIDMSGDGRYVVFSQKLIPFPDVGQFTTSLYLRDLAGGGLRTLATGNETSNVSWSGPFALSANGQRVFHQLRARTGAPVADHPTVRQLMVVRDATTGALVGDPNTGKTEIVTATADGVAFRCGIEDTSARLVTNANGSMLAYVDRDYDATHEVVPWDRNRLSDVYVIDRDVPIRAAVHLESPCTNFDIGPVIPDPHP